MSEDLGVVVEPQRETPVMCSVDVLVAGGGPSGIAAAVSAARGGASVMLVERFGYLGGMVTGSHVIWVLGMGDGARQLVYGISQEIRDRLAPLGGVRDPNKCGDYTIDPEMLKWQAAEMIRDAGADLLLHATVCDPIIEDGRVAGLITESKSGRRAIRAKVVVDCTADADIAFRAGCACDDETHDVSLIMYLVGVDNAKVAEFQAAEPERVEEILAAAKRLNGGVMPGHGRHLKGIDITDTQALTTAETVLRHDAFEALQYLRTNLPGWENATIRETLPQLGVRQGRRIHAAATVTEADIRESRRRDDTIGLCGATMDGYRLYHPAKVAYDIPFGCMLPEGVDGVLVAGRPVSADYYASNTLRLIVPCFITGQAAGAAAALAVRHGVEPRDVDIAELQDALRAQSVNLGGMEAPLPDDDEPTLDITDGGA